MQKMRLISEDKYQTLLKGTLSQINQESENNTKQPLHAAMIGNGEDSPQNSSLKNNEPNDKSLNLVKPEEVEKKQSRMSLEEILESIPKTYRKKTSRLLRAISNYPTKDLDWDENGGIIYKGVPISNTSIPHLLRHIVAPLKNFTPIGATQFNQIISDMNIMPKNTSRKVTSKIERLAPPPGVRIKRKLNRRKEGYSWRKMF